MIPVTLEGAEHLLFQEFRFYKVYGGWQQRESSKRSDYGEP
jgi:hypothetical protein